MFAAFHKFCQWCINRFVSHTIIAFPAFMLSNPVLGTPANGGLPQPQTLKSYQMPTNPQIIWCAQSSWHYIVEGSRRYAMPLFLAIQVKEHLKNCQPKNDDCVERWLSGLGPADRMLVKITETRSHVPM